MLIAPETLIDGMLRTLEEEVLPHVGTAYARGQLHCVIDVLANLRDRIEEKAALLTSAELLNAKMREIRDSGKVVGLDRVAVMAALNIANELLKAQGQDEELKNIVGLRIRAMREHLDSALGPAKQLTL